MSKTLTLDVSDEVAAFLDTPEAMQQLHEFIEAAYAQEAARIASLRRGSAQVDAKEGLPLEESRAVAHAEFAQLVAEYEAKKAGSEKAA